MATKVEFVATVGKWPEAQQDEIFAALKAWAHEDEGFTRSQVSVDILGGSPRNPILRMEAYTMGPILLGQFETWKVGAEARLREKLTAAGGSEIRIDFTFPDKD